MKDVLFELFPSPIHSGQNESESEHPLETEEDLGKMDEVRPLEKDKAVHDLSTGLLNHSLFLTQRFYAFLEKFYPSCPKCGKKMFPNFCGVYACSCSIATISVLDS
ncbi:MAG: hypothetical protein UU73_C0002G0103 [Candidatus Daviesbacteria bacterium GW2011_GWA1_41_61]|uniref:Uncharacterized protein n=1 Tax=Candidatus Daviesbacteria bacterium GW2011_GWA2_40_9 TaxID=1618424 RepID=A0A0G0WET3_9BACT|nr:MAG: hypothetical protein UU26_C0010G0026 [Candidatus Daviesbacteria bacterium GW2011_GWC1_40_9]KKR82770.1 MAG: hypothetical protein UU29_C0009G0041 [Candidatus Daviesbacteria bacterium GW2011_GWA2_40_9]KKR93763.1 MAG: hypothetical protein UU44_C0001G0103 [Candidatus Daviesbacteria bacterium GW2011_GWB1_41_15]KKS15229.1 MAG: hypothetical protein UU73_C0002G0103 [Candidatus Daviesbacteria bacterium GW2011_GWA1_41_61]